MTPDTPFGLGKWRIRREHAGIGNLYEWFAYPPPIGHLAPFIFPTWRQAIDFVTGAHR